MDTNQLSFSRTGRADRLYPVSPLLFAQRQLLNKYFLPDERDLPAHGLELRFWTFDFGFAVPGAAIAPYDTVPYGLLAGRNFLAVAITGASVPQASANVPAAGAPGAQVSPAFSVTFLHTHEGVQRQWANKDELDLQMVGKGVYPTIFKAPILIPQGDTLTAQVRNLTNSTLLVQLNLAGGEF
jgi:hypothetical protein